MKKAFPNSPLNAFNGNIPPLKWVILFEDVGMRCYRECTGATIHEFGLIPHPTLDIFAASPDGITDLGIMVEMKCPYRRKIQPGQVMEQYALQIQGQLAVCELEECDFVECALERLSITNYTNMEGSKGHGVVIEIEGADNRYSPDWLTADEALTWVEVQLNQLGTASHNLWFWRLKEINIVRVLREPGRFEGLIPEIKTFWEDVQTAAKGPEPVITPKTARKRLNVEDVSKAEKANTGSALSAFRDDGDDDVAAVAAVQQPKQSTTNDAQPSKPFPQTDYLPPPPLLPTGAIPTAHQTNYLHFYCTDFRPSQYQNHYEKTWPHSHLHKLAMLL